jgi:phage protein D
MTGLLSGLSSNAIVMPGVKVGLAGLPLNPLVYPKLTRAVVDTHVHLPDMFELTFNDMDGDTLSDANLDIGTALQISGAKAGDATASIVLIKGEVTSIEAICMDGMILSVVRGYERAHRLQRARRTKTYVNMKDSDIARQVAANAGLQIGKIDTSSTTHVHLSQIAQTDWDFLVQRAREIGFEVGVTQGKFYFRHASGQSAGGLGGGALGAVASAAAGALGLDSGLTFRQNLYTFLPRISAANITPSVEVRVWDPKAARVVVGKSDAATGTATIKGEDPKKLATTFTDGMLPSLPSLPALPPIPGLPKLDFGSTPSNTAFVVVDRPLATGSAADGAVDEVAKGLADHIASTFAEAEGDAQGDPGLQAGSQVQIKGVPKPFVGTWTITNARHVFDAEEGGYHTRFWVSGRADRSLLALSSGGAGRERQPQLPGLVCGVVTNVRDPDKQGRVKVALPWLAPDYESDWARVATLASGPRTGALFLPEVGDEVLVGFEFGDARRPYVLGGLINNNTKFAPLDTAVTGGAVTGRGIGTPAGNQLLFTDELPPGPPGPPPMKSSILLGTGDGNLALAIDQVAGTVTLTCKPAPPKSKTPAGTVTIDCSGAGKIEIKGGAGGVKIDSEGQLELNGKLGVKVTSNAIVQVQGQMIQLN